MVVSWNRCPLRERIYVQLCYPCRRSLESYQRQSSTETFATLTPDCDIAWYVALLTSCSDSRKDRHHQLMEYAGGIWQWIRPLTSSDYVMSDGDNIN